MKAVILSRVSTKEQEEGHSIEAQTSRLKEYCARKGFEILKVYQIVESSTQGDRKQFNAMLDYIEEQKEKVVLVADAVDRLQRSFKEAVLLEEWLKQEVIELHFIRENIVLNETSRSIEWVMWYNSILGAKSYVMTISDNVKRTFDNRVKMGQWMGSAPMGFLNVSDEETGKKNIGHDTMRAYLVKRGFDLYATGNYSVKQIHKILVEEGLTNRKTGRPIVLAQVHNMLKNPFYYGVMRVKGQLIPHKYEPIISEALFRECQQVMEGRAKAPTKSDSKPFVFKGIVRCAKCNCSISWDIKKGKYIYGKCSKYHGDCGAVMVKEEVLLEQIADLFKKLVVPEDVLVEIKDKLQSSHESKQKYHDDAIRGLRKEYDEIQIKLDRLLNVHIAGSITQSEYDKKAYELKQRQHEIDMSLKDHTKADENFLITVSYLLDLSCRAYELFESSKVDQKRQLLKFVLSNCTLQGKKLLYELNNPFSSILACSKDSNWLPRLDSN